MPENERRRRIPEWAERERFTDTLWIGENLPEFWVAAQRGFAEFGRGAIAADTTIQPLPEKGHPMYYIPQAQVNESGTEDEIRLVAQYDPSWEFVAMLFKQQGRSSYRVGVPGRLREMQGDDHPSQGR